MVQSTQKSLQDIRERQRDLMFGQATLSQQIADYDAPVGSSRYVFARLRTPNNLDLSNSDSMAINASGADVAFRHTVREGERHSIERLNFGGAAAAKLVPNGFYSLAALTADNGVLVRALDTDDTVIKNFGDGEILFHRALSLLAGSDVPVMEQATPPAISWGVHWTLAKAGRPLLLEAGQSLEVLLRADFSGFAFWHALIQGVKL